MGQRCKLAKYINHQTSMCHSTYPVRYLNGFLNVVALLLSRGTDLNVLRQCEILRSYEGGRYFAETRRQKILGTSFLTRRDSYIGMP